MPNFSTPQKVLQTIRAGDDVQWDRGENRRKIQDAANGVPPLTEDEAKQVGLKINVNWLELTQYLADARRQYMTAFTQTPQFFKVTLPLAPAEHQGEWGAFITQEINSALKKSRKYYELHRSRWTSVPPYGVGATWWQHPDRIVGEFVAMADLRIPTDTTLDFENLGWFGVRKYWTVFELVREVFGPNPKYWNRKGVVPVLNHYWKKDKVASILRNYKEINSVVASNNYDWETSPEKLAELVKQNGGLYASDALPTIPIYHFYYEDDGKWWAVYVPDNSVVKGYSEDYFLLKADEPVANSWEQLIHCQYGDLANDPPPKYHSIRSLGLLLMEPTFYTNLTRCRSLQHLMDNFNVWLRVNDPMDKARAQVQEFGNYGIVRQGVQIVPQGERHQIESGLLEFAMADLNQLMQKASSTYTQQIDTGSKKEQTAFEVSTRVQQVNAMLSGLLSMAFTYETFKYREECRRFCIKKSEDPMATKFQDRCKRAGIPSEWLDAERWEVEPVTPLGMGNPTMAQAMANELMQIRPALDPTAQNEVLHEVILAKTQDARKAARWVPLGKERGITDAQRDAQMIFGTLMQGVPVPPREGLPVIDQIEGMIPLFAGKIAIIEKRDNVGKPDEVMGLETVHNYLAGDNPKLSLLPRLAQDPNQKDRVKKYANDIGQLWNQVKGLAQRGQEAMQKMAQAGNGQGGPDPKALAQAQTMMMLAGVKAKATMQKAAVNERQNRERFVREQRREDAKALAEIERQGVVHRHKTATDTMREANALEAEAQRNRMKSTEE